MSGGQTLKSALATRVRIDQAQRLGSQRQNLGEGLMCPAGHGLRHDIYGRPVSEKTLLLDDASCSHYTQHSAARRIEVENQERPYVPVCAAGLRGAGDFMGKGRDLMPQNLYGEGREGHFVRHYPNPSNAPPSTADILPCGHQYQVNPVAPWRGSMDATHQTWRG